MSRQVILLYFCDKDKFYRIEKSSVYIYFSLEGSLLHAPMQTQIDEY